MLSQDFTATLEELDLAARLLRTTTRQSTGTLSRDAAIGIFKRSGLSFDQIREIWTISDRKGIGKLSKDELPVAIRLAGWVQQRGAEVHENLLSKAGPLPVLSGIPNRIKVTPSTGNTFLMGPISAFPSPTEEDIEISAIAPIPIDQRQLTLGPHVQAPAVMAINIDDTIFFEQTFEKAGPVRGLLDKETAMEIFMSLGLPYTTVDEVMSLVRSSRRHAFTLPEFTLAMHYLIGIKSRSICALPSKIPQALYDQVGWTPATPTSSNRSRETLASTASTEKWSEHSVTSQCSSSWTRVEIVKGTTGSKSRMFSPAGEASYEFTSNSSSVSVLRRRGMSSVWQRIFKRCDRIRKFPISLAKVIKGRGRPSNNTNAVLVSVSTESFSSFGATSDSWYSLGTGHDAQLAKSRLPLIYPLESGFYPSVSLPYVDVGASRRSAYRSMNLSESPDPETLEDQTFWNFIPSVIKIPEAANDTTSRITPLSDFGVVKGRETLKSQIQTSHDVVRKIYNDSLSSQERPHSQEEYVADFYKQDMENHGFGLIITGTMENDTRASSVCPSTVPISRMDQSLTISKCLQGPRPMLSVYSSDTSLPASSYRADLTKTSFLRPSGPRLPDPAPNLAEMGASRAGNSVTSSGSGQPEGPRAPRPLRSILKVKTSPQIPDIDWSEFHKRKPRGARSQPKKAPAQAVDMEVDMDQESRNKRLELFNAMFNLEPTPPQINITSTDGFELEPTIIAFRPPLPPIPDATDSEGNRSALPRPALRRLEIPSTTFSGRSGETDTGPFTAYSEGISPGATLVEPSSPFFATRSSAAYSRQLSARSSRTTLVPDIDEHSEDAVNDLKKAAPVLFLKIKKNILRELRTQSMGHSTKVPSNYDIYDVEDSFAQEVERLVAALAAKDEQLKRVEGEQTELLRHYEAAVAKAQYEAEELRNQVHNQVHLTSDLLGFSPDHLAPPAYTETSVGSLVGSALGPAMSSSTCSTMGSTIGSTMTSYTSVDTYL